MSELITLKQNAIISYDGIKKVSESVEERIKSLELDKQIATSETIKSIKETRASLSKEFREYEDQRKFIKNSFSKPYLAFEEEYKNLIASKFKNADEILKEKVFKVENEIKSIKEQSLKDYFNELSQVKKIDFTSFSQLGLNVTISASEKSLKTKIEDFLSGVEKDLSLVSSLPENHEFKTEVLVDYKADLNLNKALRSVQARRASKAKELSKADAIVEETTTPILTKKVALQSPKEVLVEELLEVSFCVKGTLKQLKTLKEYMINNNIEIVK